MFIPTTPPEELKKLGWDSLDVILVSGDTYIDSPPYSGVALIGHQLIRAGYKTGIIAQPNTTNYIDIARLGVPRLFWGGLPRVWWTRWSPTPLPWANRAAWTITPLVA